MSRQKRKLLCGILIGLNLMLIWGNSMVPGDDSGAMSDWIINLISFLPQTKLVSTILRKLAHFSEFACLGLLIGWMSVLTVDKPTVSVLGLGLAVGCIDETIQIFSAGRSSSLMDVWIDTAGFFVGLMLLTLGYTMRKRKKQLEDNKE